MVDFKRTSRGLEKDFAERVKNFHNLDLSGVFRIERGELREIAWS
jgi:hypothetical protein